MFWRAVDATFLAVLLAGVLAAVFSMSGLIKGLIIDSTTVLLSFFCGLTIAAALWIGLRLRPVRLQLAAAFCAGAAFAVAVSMSPVAELSEAPPLQGYFAAGMIALCAMVLPGISGSLILLLLGVYPFLIEALEQRELEVIAVFACGGIVGITLFVRPLRWLLVHHHDATIAVMVGLMVGALPKLWPWKEHAEGVRVVLQPPILPADSPDPQYLGAALALAGGAILVVAFETLARRLSRP